MSIHTFFRIMAAITIAAFPLTFSACTESIPTPIIGDLQVAPAEVAPGETIALWISNVAATGPVTYEWIVQQGEIVAGQGTSTIRYRAPDTPGAYVVTVKTSTGKFSQEMSIPITVIAPTPPLTVTEDVPPPTPTVVTETFAIPLPCSNPLTVSLSPYDPGCGDVGSSWGDVQYCQSFSEKFVASVDLHSLKPNENYVFSLQAAEVKAEEKAEINSLLWQSCESQTAGGDAYCDATLQPASAQGDVRYTFSTNLNPGSYALKFLLKDENNNYCVAMYNDTPQFVEVTPPSPFQKGMSYVTWQSGAFSAASADEALEELAATGTNWIALVVTGYQETITSTVIWYDLPQTSTDDDLVHVFGKARELGLNVMLKPHVDLLNDPQHWRGEIGWDFDESQWSTWFISYDNFISHYAALAAQNQDVVKIFSVGTELVATSSRETEWQQLLRKVRAGFGGKLVYASNWDEPARGWWAELDYIGVDAYFPLETASDTPSVEDLKVAWQPHIEELENLHQQYGRPLILTEIGYRSVQGAHANPAQWQQSAAFDQTEQENLYRAAMDTFCGRDWLAGMYWWNWLTNPNQGGLDDTDYTPHGKSAETVLMEYYRAGKCDVLLEPPPIPQTLATYSKGGSCQPVIEGASGEVLYAPPSSGYFRASVKLDGLKPNRAYAFTISCIEGSTICRILAQTPGCQEWQTEGYCDIPLTRTDANGTLSQNIEQALPAGEYNVKFFIKDPGAKGCIVLNNDNPDPFTVKEP